MVVIQGHGICMMLRSAQSLLLSALYLSSLSAAQNAIHYKNNGKTGISMVYSPNAGCAGMDMIDYVEPGGALVQNHANLSAECGPTQWAGMARAIEGDHSGKGPDAIQSLLETANTQGSILAEFCFQAYAGHTFYDASRVNLPCTPSNVGVKWIYPLGSTQPEHQSGCGDMTFCWNMYTWDHNDKMQLSHPATEYVVVLGDGEDTSCNDGEFECCTAVGGCVPDYDNIPSAIGSCPATPVGGYTAPTYTPPAQSGSYSTASTLATGLTTTSPSFVVPTYSPSTTIAPCQTCVSSGVITSAADIVTITETDWITITTWETVCVGPYGCYGSFGNYEPTSAATRKRALPHQHKHRGLNEHAKWH